MLTVKRKILFISFFPDVSPGFKIIESPVNLVYLPLLTDTIQNLNLSITDQDLQFIKSSR